MDFNILEDKLKNPTIHSKQLLGKATLLNEQDRESGAFTDPRYLPFYYHLGKLMKAKSVCHIDVNLGLEDVCFLQGFKTERWMGYGVNHEWSAASLNLAWRNVKKYCEDVSPCTDIDDFEELMKPGYDAFIVTHAKHLEVFRDDIWKNLSREGLLIVDNIYVDDDGEAKFANFAKSVSREPAFFKTRYGIGIVER